MYMEFEGMNVPLIHLPIWFLLKRRNEVSQVWVDEIDYCLCRLARITYEHEYE